MGEDSADIRIGTRVDKQGSLEAKVQSVVDNLACVPRSAPKKHFGWLISLLVYRKDKA